MIRAVAKFSPEDSLNQNAFVALHRSSREDSVRLDGQLDFGEPIVCWMADSTAAPAMAAWALNIPLW